MSSESENKLTSLSSTESATTTAAEGSLDRTEVAAPGEEEGESVRDRRLDRLPLRLHVMVRVRSFRVGDLLSLARGRVVESFHEHTQDVPVRCGSVVMLWAEFEVVEQMLAVRITRLA